MIGECEQGHGRHRAAKSSRCQSPSQSSPTGFGISQVATSVRGLDWLHGHTRAITPAPVLLAVGAGTDHRRSGR
ncbi:MAG: hypothetical protein ACK56I_07255 [bacterium]